MSLQNILEAIITELRSAKRASRAPCVRKFGKPFHPRKFGYDVTYARTLFAGEGRESGVSPSGNQYVIRAMHLYNPASSWQENMFTSTTSLHKNFVTVVLSF